MTLRIAIVEDDRQAAELLCKFLRRFSDEYGGEYKAVIFSDAVSFLSEYRPNFDIVFMDIELPGMDGMEAARRLRLMDESVALIFVTNMANFAVKGYEVDALDFIVKPVIYYSFSLKLLRCLKRLECREERELVLSTSNGLIRLKCSDITYVEVMKHDITIHTVNGEYRSYGSLKKLESMLPANSFVRCNNCFVVNLRHVRQIKDFEVLVGSTWLSVSQAKKSSLLRAVNEYIGSVK